MSQFMFIGNPPGAGQRCCENREIISHACDEFVYKNQFCSSEYISGEVVIVAAPADRVLGEH